MRNPAMSAMTSAHRALGCPFESGATKWGPREQTGTPTPASPGKASATRVALMRAEWALA